MLASTSALSRWSVKLLYLSSLETHRICDHHELVKKMKIFRKFIQNSLYEYLKIYDKFEKGKRGLWLGIIIITRKALIRCVTINQFINLSLYSNISSIDFIYQAFCSIVKYNLVWNRFFCLSTYNLPRNS